MVRTIKKISHSLIQPLRIDLSFIKKQTFSILIQIESRIKKLKGINKISSLNKLKKYTEV